MTKKKSIVTLTILVIVMVITSVLSFVSFKLPNVEMFGKNLGIYDYDSVISNIKLGIDLKGGVYVVLKANPEEGATEADIAKDIDGTIEILRKRLDGKGYTEATVVKQSSVTGSLIRIEIPDVENPDDVFNIIGKSAVLEFQRSDSKEVFMTGSNHVDDAFVTSDSDNKPAVGLELNKAGAEKFGKVTGEINGTQTTIDILLDGEVISSATVSNGAITGGKAVISGNFDYESAKELADLIKSGSLPMNFTQVEPKAISPTLGQDAMKLGLIAGIIGVAFVMIFMSVYYRGLGIVSSISLLIYTLLLLIALAVFPFVQLTLAGIAGIILSIGMAVDANVIIFERIKEEYRLGKTLKAAINAGFKRALSSILDSNITTMLASGVLYFVGTGTIKGFAITLFLGIVISMFCALVVTKSLIKVFLPLNSNAESFYNLKREA